jgi:hypothetical protein
LADKNAGQVAAGLGEAADKALGERIEVEGEEDDRDAVLSRVHRRPERRLVAAGEQNV